MVSISAISKILGKGVKYISSATTISASGMTEGYGIDEMSMPYPFDLSRTIT